MSEIRVIKERIFFDMILKHNFFLTIEHIELFKICEQVNVYEGYARAVVTIVVLEFLEIVILHALFGK